MTVLRKSLEILDLFLEETRELSLEEIAHRTGMNKTTTRRIAVTLIKSELLKQQKTRGKYSLGGRFLSYAQAFKKQNPIISIAKPFIVKLEHAVDETVALALWDGFRLMICDSVTPSHPLKVAAYEGTMTGLHHNSLGKAVLAALPESLVEEIVGDNMNRYTQNTITTMNDLKKHLLVSRQEGIAIDDEEGFSGVKGIGAVFYNNEGAIAGAITVIGPSIRLTHEKIREFKPIVKECAESISAALGYNEKI